MPATEPPLYIISPLLRERILNINLNFHLTSAPRRVDNDYSTYLCTVDGIAVPLQSFVITTVVYKWLLRNSYAICCTQADRVIIEGRFLINYMAKTVEDESWRYSASPDSFPWSCRQSAFHFTQLNPNLISGWSTVLQESTRTVSQRQVRELSCWTVQYSAKR